LEAERFTQATGVACEPLIELKTAIPEVVAETAIRAISEGLTNIARHARAGNVTLRLSELGTELEIEIRDDGIGFDPQAVQPGHYGCSGCVSASGWREGVWRSRAKQAMAPAC